MTMVKAEVDDSTDEYIDRVRDKLDVTKAEATAYLLRKAAMSEDDETGKWVVDDE